MRFFKINTVFKGLFREEQNLFQKTLVLDSGKAAKVKQMLHQSIT